MNTIFRANKKAFIEVLNQPNSENAQDGDFASNLESIFRNFDLLPIWEARAEEKKAAEIAKNMIRDGISEEQTAELSGLDIVKIKALCDTL